MATKEEKEFKEIVYTIPLRDLLRTPRTSRAPKAIKLIRAYVARHRKTDPANIWIDKEVNEFIWSRGIEHPPNKVILKVSWYEGEDLVGIYLPDE
ncbi:MAG: 50S ribosomal protein L31e [Candidatus Thermoplasmatota archaeon]|nr:50S ribosomal protein L31e [Euryarchaeota archaeon]MBU4032762.1 50S ribosomal protein L31e [Candidatus Thermoplasmatota archaeon]MBU4071498.1 50S ribosomal protein L31e [Candidatus Thermoplasmatota archaeon]MBU4143419.1 50S ribosomal protein L31e [Candidatus Thermoplasmatota archaeon]MBU4592448.1 50S ribosomal protein L31e [Candidatus Thermoplasmatota archaeon]